MEQTRVEQLAETLWRETRHGRAASPSGHVLEAQHAERQLSHILNSRSWRLFDRLRPGAARADEAQLDPRVRLERVLASRRYRLIRALKRTPPYRLYARIRYGPGWAQPLGLG